MSSSADVVIVGGGAAGLATGIFTARRRPDLRVLVLDGARKLGAKILVSGGGRCNVTNAVVTERDFWGGSRHSIRQVLKAFPASEAVRFFEEMGVELHEEENGKLFPNTNRAHTILDALLAEAGRTGLQIETGGRVTALERTAEGFTLGTGLGPVRAARVVLATGGLSLPKTGSDGLGLALARRVGHGVVPTTPALVPLVLDGDFHSGLSGVSHPAEITVRSEGRPAVRLQGSLLWTHFGVSGPVVLNASRSWHRATVEGRQVSVAVNFVPGETFESMERKLIAGSRVSPAATIASALGEELPASVATAILAHHGVDLHTRMAQLDRNKRRTLVHALTAWPLPVKGSRGYSFAEVTAGGIPLDEIDPRTMASRKCPGLFLVGEMLDVDGRIGGFNFQWSWSSASVAAEGLTRSPRAS